MEIKIIWDFFGEDGHETAKHHAIHLEEFCVKENISAIEIGIDTVKDLHTIAFVTVNKPDMIIVRDVLKPHRAELV